MRNRTTQELEESTPLDAVRQNEAAFFKKHPQLSNLRKERRGIDALVAQLVQVQVQCIVKNLPNLKKKASGQVPPVAINHSRLARMHALAGSWQHLSQHFA